ncbi:MAG: alpha/beta fold hydrolase [Lysobacteraceae bacterium]|nr:MAG: alpha/beta fold hydrolase [Xanthomonadaceae bacterium]
MAGGASPTCRASASSPRWRSVALHAADYHPPWWLRNGHLQTMLGASPWRQRLGAHALAATGAVTTSHLVDGGAGVRLHGLHSVVPGAEPRGLALLLHGWEGSAESSYMRLAAAQFLQRGFATFRLEFRDHGDSHHLNQALFHSNRIDEVVLAACDVSRRFRPHATAAQPMVAAGFSLGGNFALRLALRAPDAGLSLAGVAAVCPVIDPAAALVQMESGWPMYLHYFERKWRRSLQRKRALFPAIHDYDDRTLQLGMRELTEWLVLRHTDFGSLENYFNGYSIAGERLAALQVPARILMAEDDPVIPIEHFRALRLPPEAHLEIAAQGGHCGFLLGAGGAGFAEAWIADGLAGAAPAR